MWAVVSFIKDCNIACNEPERTMQYKYTHDSDVVLITIDEPLQSNAQINDLVEKVQHFTKQGKAKFVVDLGELASIDTRALGTLVSCRLKSKRAGGDFVLVNVPEAIMSLIGITHLIPIFTIAKSVKEGKELLKRKKDKAE